MPTNFDAKFYHDRQKRDEAQWRRVVPPTDDLLFLVLKGHLLIEEQMQAIIEGGVQNPVPVRSARLTFHQRSRISESMAEWLHPGSSLWRVADKVNAIRNRLAHQAEPHDIPSQLKELFAISDKSASYENFVALSPDSLKLYAVLQTTWATLSVLRDVVAIIAQHSIIGGQSEPGIAEALRAASNIQDRIAASSAKAIKELEIGKPQIDSSGTK